MRPRPMSGCPANGTGGCAAAASSPLPASSPQCWPAPRLPCCVWPEVNAEVHPGRLVLFVADQDMSRAKAKAWPLLKSGTVDLFRPFPFGTDPRGRLVTLTLMYASMIIGSIPRMGKTFALRLILLAASLDPRAWILAFDLKGTGDLSALEPVAHRYRAGDD